MKKYLLLGLGLMSAVLATAQSSKQVQWNYTAKKIADKTYEIHLSATINGDYHMYAQDAGGEGPVPTLFTFTQNPLIVMNGKVKESGKLISKFESAWKHDVKYYEKTVDFIQVVKLKANVKTSLSGKVEFMLCNDKQCLPPAEVEIKVNVGE
jgi:thiol:disulfide interchange protein DsbD